MSCTLFGQNQKQTCLNPSYQDASGQTKHPLFARSRFKFFLCRRQSSPLSSNFYHTSERHTGQQLFTVPYFPFSVKRITSNIPNLFISCPCSTKEGHSLIPGLCSSFNTCEQIHDLSDPGLHSVQIQSCCYEFYLKIILIYSFSVHKITSKGKGFL